MNVKLVIEIPFPRARVLRGPLRLRLRGAPSFFLTLFLMVACGLFQRDCLMAGPLGRESGSEAFAESRWKPRLLPGHLFTFSMSGTPGGDLEALRQLVGVMRERGLGNGFDPGPSAHRNSRPLFEYLATVGWPVICYPGYADMQVMDGNARLGDEDERAVQVLDRAGVFSTVQLGEWGYYFHNLSSSESWWRAVYGDAFEERKGSMKPTGLNGYDVPPRDRRECFEIVRNYYQTRDRFMRGRNFSVTGHSHYEAYVAEWGAPLIGLELGENIAFTQSKIAFARGAARRWQRPFSIQVSPWFAGSCTTRGPLRMEGKYARGLDAGHSLSFYERLWLHSWFSGAAMVTPENSIAIFFEEPAAPWTLTSHGEKAAETFAFMRDHERGVPYTQVAIVLDHLNGFNGYKGKPWGILDSTEGDREVDDLLHRQIWPDADFIHAKPDSKNPESGYLRSTPYGESFDVLLSNADLETLASYPVVLFCGDVEFGAELIARLHRVLRSGTRVVLGSRHARVLGEDLAKLQVSGDVHILEPWINPKTGRSAAISEDALGKLVDEFAPMQVSGDPVQTQINRTSNGWVIEVVNHRGVIKTPVDPAEIDETAIARVVLKPRFPVREAVEWGRGERLPPPVVGKGYLLEVPPGQTRFVEFLLPTGLER